MFLVLTSVWHQFSDTGSKGIASYGHKTAYNINLSFIFPWFPFLLYNFWLVLLSSSAQCIQLNFCTLFLGMASMPPSCLLSEQRRQVSLCDFGIPSLYNNTWQRISFSTNVSLWKANCSFCSVMYTHTSGYRPKVHINWTHGCTKGNSSSLRNIRRMSKIASKGSWKKQLRWWLLNNHSLC